MLVCSRVVSMSTELFVSLYGICISTGLVDAQLNVSFGQSDGWSVSVVMPGPSCSFVYVASSL